MPCRAFLPTSDGGSEWVLGCPLSSRKGRNGRGAWARLGRSSLIPTQSPNFRFPHSPARRLLPAARCRPCTASAPGLAGAAASTRPAPLCLMLCQGNTWSRHLFYPQKASPSGMVYLIFRIVTFFFCSEEGFAGEGKAPLAGAGSVPTL